MITAQKIQICPIQNGKLHEECEIPEQLTILEDQDQPTKDHGIFRVLSVDGDTRIVWNKFSLPEVQAAKKAFKDLIEKGMVAYKVGRDGKMTSEVLSEFDPKEEEIILAPIRMLAGG